MAKRRNPQSSDTPLPVMKHKPKNAPSIPFKEKEELPPMEVATPPEEIMNANQQHMFNIQTLENNVSECLKILDDTVMHSYVTRLSELPIVEPYFDEEKMRKEPYQFFHIIKLVYEQDEFSVSKLSTIFQALSGKNCTLVLMVQNINHITNFYLGVRDHEEKDFTGTLRQMLEMSLKGQFPGSDFNSGFSVENMQKITDGLKNTSAVSCVSCVPDFKQDKDFFENKDFLQGLEKFVISMQDKDYTAVFVADSVPYDELVLYRTQLESVCTQLSPFASMQFQISTSNSQSNANTEQSGQTNTNTKGESDTTGTNASVAQGETEGETDTEGIAHTHGTNSSVTDTESKGKTVTDGTNESVADGVTKTQTVTVGTSQTVGSFGGASVSVAPFGIGGGVNAGVSASVSLNESYSHSTAKSHTVTKGTNHSVAISETVSKALTKGVSDSTALSNSKAKSKSTSNTQTLGVLSQHGTNSSYSEAFNFGHAETITDTFGTSQGITMQSQNMMIINMLERIKKQIARLDECESIGMWNCAAYFMSSERAISETAANTYRSLISGEKSGVERSAINTWTDKNSLPMLTKYVTHFCHPKFEYISADEPCLISPASLISTKELAIEMSLPRKSVCGLPVIEHAVFGQQIVKNDAISISNAYSDSIPLGNVYHLNTKTDVPVNLDMRSLTMHTFITGSTGAGKSNTVYHILDELSDQKISYLVIEPAKGEYKTKFIDAQVYGTNPNNGELLKLNPFAFPKEIHVQEHIDRLSELFNVCWVMYAAMPAVLKDSIIRAYESAGWDMNKSINTVNERLFPTFEDVLREIDIVIQESDYSGDTSSDYKGALKTRLRSLTNGINGMIFSSREVSNQNLFDSKTIVDLSRVGSIETKSLMMGVLVLKLQEYRMSSHKETDSNLRHITVLEEAHNLLKKTSTEQGQETANLQGKSVEMLTNAIAEMRTYGEGFIIVDQAPDLLDTAVIRNTNTKIVMRLPEGTDREITGLSMALDENQVTELSKLPQGVAAVYQNNWQEAVLCTIPEFKFVELPRNSKAQRIEYDEYQTLKLLLSADKMSPSLLHALVLSDAPAKVRRGLIQHIEKNNIVFEWAMADYITSRFNWKNVFEGTNRSCTTIDELGELMLANIEEEFSEFSQEEAGKICYYICRKAHELFPQNAEIENVRVDFFKKRWLI
jgi:DNA helicase HerA-like ATPase